jgi:hypothetical protein
MTARSALPAVRSLHTPAEHLEIIADRLGRSSKPSRISDQCESIKLSFLTEFDSDVVVKDDGELKYIRPAVARTRKTRDIFLRVKNACREAGAALSAAPAEGWLPKGEFEVCARAPNGRRARARKFLLTMGSTELSTLFFVLSELADAAESKCARPGARSTPEKDLCAKYAYMLFREFSDRRPGRAEYLEVANHLYGFITGLSEDLEASCKKELAREKRAKDQAKENREVPKRVSRTEKLHVNVKKKIDADLRSTKGRIAARFAGDHPEIVRAREIATARKNAIQEQRARKFGREQ